jgi:hypothetical protein
MMSYAVERDTEPQSRTPELKSRLINQYKAAQLDISRHRPLTALEKLNIALAEWRKIFTQTIDHTGLQRVNREIQLSVENQRTIQHWGDELEEKDHAVFRVYASDVNGFTLDRRGGQFAQYC